MSTGKFPSKVAYPNAAEHLLRKLLSVETEKISWINGRNCGLIKLSMWQLIDAFRELSENGLLTFYSYSFNVDEIIARRLKQRNELISQDTGEGMLSMPAEHGVEVIFCLLFFPTQFSLPL